MNLLKELKELDAKATSAPWNNIVKMDGFTAVGANTLIARVFSTEYKDFENEKANARLIAASRNALPDLIRVIELAEEALRFYEDGNCGEVAQQALAEIKKLKGD